VAAVLLEEAPQVKSADLLQLALREFVLDPADFFFCGPLAIGVKGALDELSVVAVADPELVSTLVKRRHGSLPFRLI